MSDGLLVLAVSAGMLAAVNPCGFALLPAYLGLLVTGDQPSRRAAVRRALALTLAMTLGFMAVFGVFGLIVAPVASSLQQYLPWFTIVFGVLLAGLGGWLAAGRRLPSLPLHGRGPAALNRSPRSMIAFGMSYAVASLSCTIAPFLAVVVSTFRSGTIFDGILLFLAYSAGMGLVVGTAAVAVALTRTELVRRLRRAGAVVPRIAGILLLVSGAYVAYYGWWETRILRGAGATDDPVIATAADIQRHLAAAVNRIGWLGLVLLLAALLALALLRTRRHHRRFS
ncbi:MAG: cytochrome c biogenesis protein CcdA [Catenulispora sp.]|nr:cytochrome c biogenesis protein CcdA [Catenulispora sp.]